MGNFGELSQAASAEPLVFLLRSMELKAQSPSAVCLIDLAVRGMGGI